MLEAAVAVLAVGAEGAGADADRDGAGDRPAGAGDEDAAGADAIRREFVERDRLDEAEEARAVAPDSCLVALAVAVAVAPVPVAPVFNMDRFALLTAAEVVVTAPLGGTMTASLLSKVPPPSFFDVIVLAATALVGDNGGWDGASFPAHT